MASQIIRPPNKQPPIMSMITRGRRALDEGWRKINIHPDPDTGAYLIDNQPTEAPADNQSIIVPGLGNISVEMADFILEWQREKAKDRAKKPKQDPKQVERELNEAWFAYMEQKLAMFQGKTTVGPAGFHQRERLVYARR